MKQCRICQIVIPIGANVTCKSPDCKKKNQELHNIKHRDKVKKTKESWKPCIVDIPKPKSKEYYPVNEVIKDLSYSMVIKLNLHRRGLTVRKPYIKKRVDLKVVTYNTAVWFNEFTMYELVMDKYNKYKENFNYKYLESTRNFVKIYNDLRNFKAKR